MISLIEEAISKINGRIVAINEASRHETDPVVLSHIRALSGAYEDCIKILEELGKEE